VIGGVEWEYVAASGAFAAQLADPRRDLGIAWDAGDRTFYLSVYAPPVPNMEGSVPRSYTAPLSLLAVTLLLPREFHGQVMRQCEHALEELTDGSVLELIHEVVDAAPQGWPNVVKAGTAMKALAGLTDDMERLALDVAGVGAWDTGAVPV
jgi:hypothetical protein